MKPKPKPKWILTCICGKCDISKVKELSKKIRKCKTPEDLDNLLEEKLKK